MDSGRSLSRELRELVDALSAGGLAAMAIALFLVEARSLASRTTAETTRPTTSTRRVTHSVMGMG